MNGVNKLNITTTFFAPKDPIRLPSGTVSLPSLCFSSDTNTGIYSSIPDNFDISVNGVNKLNIATTFFAPKDPIQAVAGTVGAPAYSFGGSPGSGMYQSTSSNLDFALNTSTKLTISSTEFNIKQKLEISTGLVDAYINSASGQNIFSTSTLLNRYISSNVYSGAQSDNWTVLESNADLEGCALAINGETAIIINPGDASTLWWLDEDDMTTATNYTIVGWKISTTGVITTSSDRRLKKDIYKIEKENILNDLLNIDIVKYKKKPRDDTKLYKKGKLRKKYQEEHMGVIAQNVQKHFEDVVETQSDDDKTLSVKYQDLTYYFHMGTQELIQKVKRLEEENKRLKTDIEKIQIFLNNRFNFT